MIRVNSAVLLAAGLALAACDGTEGGLSSSQAVYAAPSGYYNSPVYSPYGAYAEPGYVAPYPYQPGYAGVYGYQRRFDGRNEGWREREYERRERGGRFYQNEGGPYGQPRQGFNNGGPAFNNGGQGFNNGGISAQPRNLAPAPPPQAAAPPPPARGPVEQNKQLLDQLGFRPSR